MVGRKSAKEYSGVYWLCWPLVVVVLKAPVDRLDLPNGDEHMDPDLPVLDGVPEVLEVVLVGQ